MSASQESGKAPTILQRIYAQRQRDVEAAKATPGTRPEELDAYLEMGLAPALTPFVSRLKENPSTATANPSLSLMAEIKRASPSKGDIAPFVNPAKQALLYAQSGASVISVLTEPTWFKGSLVDMHLVRKAIDALPNRPAVLRKEFIFSEYQIAEARLWGADTVLLIVAMLTQEQLERLYAYSLRLGMEPLVEVNNAVEMKCALAIGAKVIGVNNRNLHDFSVDMGTTSGLVDMVRERDVVLCALSGIQGPADVQAYKGQGVNAVLGPATTAQSPAEPSKRYHWPPYNPHTYNSTQSGFGPPASKHLSRTSDPTASSTICIGHGDSSMEKKSASVIRVAAKSVAGALSDDFAYAIVGGAACILLGGQRVTEDIDFVVPKGSTPKARQLLKASGMFTIDPRTLHTKHTETDVEIEILAPPKLFQGVFDESTPTVTVDDVRVLHPLLILNVKCKSLLWRPSEMKKFTDGQDIAFLLDYCVCNEIKVMPGDVPNATPELVEYTVLQGWVARETWNAAGYQDGSGWQKP
ncbi:hypothetical protein ACG7TL_000911 [Trametes sanguinea]